MDLESAIGKFERRDWETTTPDTLRVAVVGVGSFVRRRALPAIGETDYCELGAAVSGDPEKARAVAEDHDARPLSYEEFEDGTGADAYDAVYVATPNALHLPYAEAAADLGKHVICEKPLEGTVERAAAMVEACADAGVTLMTAYRLQTDPALRRAREAVRGGLLGEVIHAHGDFSFRFLEGGSADGWRLDPDLAGGGALYDIGVYPLNTTRFLLDADPTGVSARIDETVPDFEVDEQVAFQVGLDGAVGAFTASYNRQNNQSLTLEGTEGRLAVEPPYRAERNRRLVLERGGRRLEYQGEYVNEVAEQFDYLAHAVHAGERPEPDGEDGLTDMEVLAAVYEADRTGRRVDL